ncbi:MAG TPA: FAD-binding oxidoreductase [Desulfosalsimonadaceae bacterium]|nr:FAD-binding oxidoreductase [Desulfosalsimonadaceae bacterium]
MYRWNGWGDDQIDMPLPAGAAAMLEELVGKTRPGPACAKTDILPKIPETRIRAPISLISTDPDERLRHAYGQSFPDWIGFRFGALNRFPDGVAYPATPEEINDILAFAEQENGIIIPYGGGTSVVGHLSTPDIDQPVISLSLERLNRLKDINPDNRLATFEAGVRGPYLEAQLKTHGYTLGHYPQSFEQSTLGGWVVTRSSGQQSLYFGRIEDLFAGGSLITAKGTMDFLPCPASAAGPDLRQIVLGSEGRMGVLADARIRISEMPEADDIYGVFFPSWDKAVDAVRALTAAGLPLSMVRLSNPMETVTNLILAGHEKQIAMLKHYLRLRGLFDNTYCMALIGLIGTRRNAHLGWRNARDVIKAFGGVAVGKSMGNAWKKNRFLAPYLRNTLWEYGYGVDTLETAVNWDNVRPTMTAVEAAIRNTLSDKGENVHVFSHLSHVYSSGSSIYSTFVFRLAETAEETMDRWRRLKAKASQTIVDAGGTISHQHGVGTDHKPYLPAEKGEIGIDLLNHIWTFADPEGRMNPGKLS